MNFLAIECMLHINQKPNQQCACSRAKIASNALQFVMKITPTQHTAIEYASSGGNETQYYRFLLKFITVKILYFNKILKTEKTRSSGPIQAVSIAQHNLQFINLFTSQNSGKETVTYNTMVDCPSRLVVLNKFKENQELMVSKLDIVLCFSQHDLIIIQIKSHDKRYSTAKIQWARAQHICL